MIKDVSKLTSIDDSSLSQNRDRERERVYNKYIKSSNILNLTSDGFISTDLQKKHTFEPLFKMFFADNIHIIVLQQTNEVFAEHRNRS